MLKPLISIIVPIYNVQNYIGRCIESVEYQDFFNWELILIDDGSTDESLLICQRYAEKDDRIKVFTQKNFGVSVARNKGLDLAVGEYITFIDGDDYWIDKKFLNAVEHADSVDVIYNPNLIIQYPNGAKREENGHKEFSEDVIHENPAYYLARNLKKKRWGCVFFVIKKNIIDIDNTRFNRDVKIGEDADWVFRTIKNANSMKIIDNMNYTYCVNRVGSSMTKKKVESVCSFFEMTKKWHQIADNSPELSPIFILFCNNAMDYFHTFGIYHKDDRSKLILGLKASGAYEFADSPVAVSIRMSVKKYGLNTCVFWMGLKHRLKMMGSSVKSKLLR